MTTLKLPLILVALCLVAGCASTGDEPEKWNAEFYNHNAQRLFDGARYNEALDQFVKALNVEPENKVARMGRAWCLVFIGEGQILAGDAKGGDNVQLARVALEELKDFDYGDDAFKVTLGQGKVAVLLGDLYAARATRLKADAERRPLEDLPHAAIREAETNRDQEYAKAEQHFRQVLSLRNDPGARDNLTALIQLARLEILGGDYESALLYSERYLEQVDRSKKIWVEADRRYTDPADRAIWETKLAGAVRKEIEVRDLIANTLFKLKRYDAALEQLDQVILLDPVRGDAYLNRGILHEILGSKSLAVADLHEFLRRAVMIDIDPGDERVVEATRRLIRLQKELGLDPIVPDPEKETGTRGT